MGDCLRACVASIFEVDIDCVPNFVELGMNKDRTECDSRPVIAAWLRGTGLAMNWRDYNGTELWKPRCWHPGWWIAGVRSRIEQGDRHKPAGNHAIVMWAGEPKWDPNPQSRAVNQPYFYRGERWFEAYDGAMVIAK